MTVTDQLDRIINWLNRSLPFLHVRFNDGEFNHMFELVPTGTRLGNNREASIPELRDASLKTFTRVLASYIAGKRILIGSFLGSSFHRRGFPRLSAAADAFITNKGWKEKIEWACPDLWYCTETEENLNRTGGQASADKLLEMLGILQQQNCVLIGCSDIVKASECLECPFVLVRKTDSWFDGKNVLRTCEPLAKDGRIFIWCAGVAGKTWAWKLWSKYPQSSHIDAGHLFDPVCGWKSRMWMQRSDGPHWKEYEKKILPFLSEKRK